MEYSKVNQAINRVTEEKKDMLKTIFPSVIKDGVLDVDALLEEIGIPQVSVGEKYELLWAGKNEAKRNSRADIIGKTLNFCEEDSLFPEDTENVYIEGDNLEVLKLIRQNYYGAVKMVYIDPPYNTGNDFVYNDDFSMSDREVSIEEGNRNEIGERYTLNAKSQNKYHANWLNMMYSRLRVAKDIMADDGVIFISIDDNEVTDLRKLCDEIFGEENFVAQIILENDSRARPYGVIATTHEYILMYVKSEEYSPIPLVDENKEFQYEDEEGGFTLYELRNRNIAFNIDNRPNLYYSFWLNPEKADSNGLYEIDLQKHEGWIEVYPLESNGVKTVWRWGKSKAKENLNTTLFGRKSTTGNWQIVKKYRESTYVLNSVWTNKEFKTDRGTLELKKIFGKKVFDFPKPVDLIKQLMKFTLASGDIVLDFFSGSATVAEATMRLNAEDNGKRKYILVQLPEVCDANSEAYKAGFANICEIGKERIRRVGKLIKDDYSEANIDIGFKVFRVADTNIKWNSIMDMGQLDVSQIESDPDSMDFMPNTKDIDVVYELMLRQRDVALSESVELLSDIGNRTYLYASSFLVCLETEVTESLVEKIAAIDPLPIKFIFRDSAFKDDIALKDETFRRLKALVEKNSGESKPTYTVEFI